MMWPDDRKRCLKCGKRFRNPDDEDYCTVCDSQFQTREDVEKRIAEVRDSWDEDTRYAREHGLTVIGRKSLNLLRSRPTVEIPRSHGFREDGRKAAGSPVGLGYDQQDLYFEYLEYMMDHEE